MRLKTKWLRQRMALMWGYLYLAQHHFLQWVSRHGALLFVILLLFAIAASFYLAPRLQAVLEPVLTPHFETFRAMMLALGAALVGAAAIAFSLVMFAMQVNVERMPHGMFRRLSSDWKLLGAFMVTFLLAIAVISISLVPGPKWIAVASIGAIWGTALILILFLYGYRRALFLINPMSQLQLLVEETARELQGWGQRAQRLAPLLESHQGQEATSNSDVGSRRTTHDMARFVFFQANPNWTDAPRRAITHAVSFSRRYAEVGDYEVQWAALAAVVTINAAYVSAKGKTLFHDNPFVSNPLSRDAFITETLEHLRQNARIGVMRGDEQQIWQTLRALETLVRVYVAIDYSDEYASKTHAHLAAGYLASTVETVVPHNMADVLMEGARLMGKCAHHFLARERPDAIRSLVERIAQLAAVGVVKEDYRPVTLACMEQLASLTFALLRVDGWDVRVAAGHLRESVAMIAKLFLAIPDTPLSSLHSTYLGPYYSGRDFESLQARLTQLVNGIGQAEADSEPAKNAIRHISQWADGLYRIEKELLLAAIERRSGFTFDITHWITHITQLLLAVSNAPACDGHITGELRRHATWLISTLSFVPDDSDVVTFVETYGMTEQLFEAAQDAQHRDCLDVAKDIRKLLLDWAFKGGRHQTGRAILERALCGLTALVVLTGDAQEGERLKALVADQLSRDDAPSTEIRSRATERLKAAAQNPSNQSFSHSSIDHALAAADQARLRPLLEEIADSLSPSK